MSFIEIAKTIEIPIGQMKSFTIGSKDILIINNDNNYFVTDARCTHMGGELAKGKLQGKIVTCPRHGAKFDISTGSNISGPKIGLIKLKAQNLATYEVKIENDAIKINL